MMMSIGQPRKEDLVDIFEPNAKTTFGYALAKAKEVWKE
jgi:hypothetical protein